MHLFHRLTDVLPISQYLLKRYAEEVTENPDQVMGFLVRMLYAETYRVDLHEDDLIAVCTRIKEHGDKVEQKAAAPDKKVSSVRSKGGFSDYYNNFMDKLDMTELCLWLADMDPARARKLYFEEDYEVVEKLAEFKQGYEREKNRLMFEGALFGFGGKYGSSSGRDEGDVRVHDLTGKTAAEVMATVSKLGQRH